MVKNNNSNNSLLSLSTQRAERKKITIDDVVYEIKNREELTLAEQHEMGRMAKIIEILSDSENEDKHDDIWYEKKYARILKLVEKAIKSIVFAPPEVLSSLQDEQRIQIFSTVFGEGTGEAPKKAPKMKEKSI